MDNYRLHVQESVNLTIYLYAQTMGQRRILYIRKFYVVKNIYISIYIHRWDTGTQLKWRVANIARNDLRAWGAWGMRSTPTNYVQLVGYKTPSHFTHYRLLINDKRKPSYLAQSKSSTKLSKMQSHIHPSGLRSTISVKTPEVRSLPLFRNKLK